MYLKKRWDSEKHCEAPTKQDNSGCDKTESQEEKSALQKAQQPEAEETTKKKCDREWCIRMQTKHGVSPGSSWGSMRDGYLKKRWDSEKHCEAPTKQDNSGCDKTGTQYTAGFYGTARRCEKCKYMCVPQRGYKHKKCIVDASRRIYGDCLTDPAAIDICASKTDGNGFFKNGSTVNLPIPKFTKDQSRWGVQNASPISLPAADCKYYNSQETHKDTGQLTAMKGIRHCQVQDFGMQDFSRTHQTTKKFSITCQLFKYFNCKYNNNKATCVNQKHSACIRVCDAKSWAGCDHAGGKCPPNLATCTTDCNKHGRDGTFWCAMKAAGL